MPPKAKKSEPSKKTEMKKKEKVVEDKTFGMKNKKGTKQQKYIKMVHQQVTQGGQKTRQLDKLEADRRKDKDAKLKAKDDLNLLFKPVEQKVGKGVDPKSVVCAFFKQGQCQKGAKCKFSHDLNIGRKAEKRSIYADASEKSDTMDDWDEQKLEEVVNKKHGESNKSKPKTTIICKFFLEAVESSKYGWFWQCPTGETCHYKHALPQGFVLKKDKKKDEKVDEISMEDLIEKERAALNSGNLTKVTLETFLKWKEKKKAEKIAKLRLQQDKKKADFKSGKVLGISGRELFEFNPDLVTGDDEEADDDALAAYKKDKEAEELEENGEGEEKEYDGPVREINLEALAAEAKEVDGSGTQKSALSAPHGATVPGAPPAKTEQGEESKLDEAAAYPTSAEKETELAIQAAMAATLNGDVLADAPIDENLFDGDDIDFVEDELETLELDD